MDQFLAFDLGATSGRGVLGTLDGGRLRLEEVCRFPTGGVQTPTRLYWNVLGFYERMLDGLRATLRDLGARGERLASVGVDGWGVDYALLDASGSLAFNPVHYRDPRTRGEPERLFAGKISKERLYEVTGLQVMELNTLFQLSAHAREDPTLAAGGWTFLHVPDLFHYWLSGRVACEYTIASTSQLLDVRARDWSGEVLGALGLDRGNFPGIVPPGTDLGPLHPVVAREVGASDEVRVVVPASHDTASAVAAVPATGDRPWAYVSAGTWSLVGVEVGDPVLTPDARRANFTNEGGVGGTYRFLRNVQGLWILNRCKEKWFAADPSLNHEEVSRLAAEAPEFAQFVFVDHESFLLPDDMEAAVAGYCRRTGQRPPRGVGQVARCVLQSMAFRYREVLDSLDRLVGARCGVVHVVGGGSLDAVHCQFTANATGRTVVAGPAEATAVGNLLVQAAGAGLVGGLEGVRRVVRNFFSLATYQPSEPERWDEAYRAYLAATTLRESY
ncbi:MAG: rhamnulokinase family protein [Promethearchaeota archaeon]